MGKSDIDEIRALIASDEVEKAISFLRQLLNARGLSDILGLIEAEYSELKGYLHGGSIGIEAFMQHKSRLRMRLLELILAQEKHISSMQDDRKETLTTAAGESEKKQDSENIQSEKETQVHSEEKKVYNIQHIDKANFS